MKPFLALPKIVLFYALPQVLSPFTRSAKESLLNVAFIHEISCQKSRRRRFAPSGTSLSSWHYFVILSHLLLNRRGSAASNKGFTSNGRLTFSPPPPHGDTPSLRISFTSQTPQESQRIIPTSPLIAMTKILFFPSRKRSYSRGYAILPQRWAGCLSTTDTDFQRNKNFARYREHGLRFLLTLQAKAVGCMLSLCEKTDYPRVLFLISSLLFAKSSPFSGKSRLVFPPSSRASFFSSRSA